MTCRTLELYYHINAKSFDKQYKDMLSGYRTWSELDHADEWLVFPDNIGPRLAIDETSMSNGELRTIVTNRDRHGRDRSLVAIVKGVKSEEVIKALKLIPEELLERVALHRIHRGGHRCRRLASILEKTTVRARHPQFHHPDSRVSEIKCVPLHRHCCETGSCTPTFFVR